MQYEPNAAADKVVQLIKRMLALPLSAQAKLLLLRKSLQLKILHLSSVAFKSDVVRAIRKLEQEILAGILHIMKCSDVQVDTAQISLPVQLGGLGVHLMSDGDGAACDAAFLAAAAAALTHRAVSGGSKHFDPFKGASGVELTAMLSGLYDKVQPFLSQAALGGLDVVTDSVVENGLPGFAHAVLTDLAVWRQQLLKQGLYPENCRRVRCVADVTAEAWLNALPVASNCLWGDGDVVSSLR